MPRVVIPRLHVITNDAVLQQPGFLNDAAAVLRALPGRVALHIRARELPAATLFQIVSQLAPVAAAAGAALLVNDRVDVALTAHAHGVQLGVRSLPVTSARQLLGDRLIGYSAHSAQECAAAAQDGADFLFAGSIYPTASHAGVAPAGIPLLEACVSSCAAPVLAIGGVEAGRVAEVRRAGAHGAAVIRAVWRAPDPVHAAQELARLLES
jgi:thiamine-phosphate pyrophosphorylase